MVANHPFGFIEGGILASLLRKLRPDVKIMANSLLAAFPEASDLFLLVNPFGGRAATQQNQQGLKQAFSHLRQGAPRYFPCGRSRKYRSIAAAVVDPAWNANVARLIRLTRATALPVYFTGTNGPLFHLAGFIHPKLRTALLPHELLNKQNRSIEVRVGSVVPPARLAAMDDETAIAYLRRRTYLLQHRRAARVRIANAVEVAIIPPVASPFLTAEIAALPGERKLVSISELDVYYAGAHEIPGVLREIGRLREITFRAAGEGSGKATDIDSFDAHYLQLFIWNREKQEVVGGYRLGEADLIRSRFGIDGLYTHTLFRYDDRFLDALGPALEMGRSFVRHDYQKTYAPLLLLWKGIGAYVARNPRYAVLFGPVSISNDYQPVSRQLLVSYFDVLDRDSELSKLVRARNPFRVRQSEVKGHWDLEELSAMIADIETDHKGVPVLLRQYLKLGGKLVAFNVDPHFANALDGLIVVDLRRTEVKTVERYLGRQAGGLPRTP
ncbi:MAG: GNAT family N-acyltransferase [Bryobacteraceae bacterium]